MLYLDARLSVFWMMGSDTRAMGPIQKIVWGVYDQWSTFKGRRGGEGKGRGRRRGEEKVKCSAFTEYNQRSCVRPTRREIRRYCLVAHRMNLLKIPTLKIKK